MTDPPRATTPPRPTLPGRLLLVALLVFLAGVIYSHTLGNQVRYTDEHDYLKLAQNLASTWKYSYNGVDPTAVRTPGYPFFLALILSAGAGLFVLRLAGFLALAASICLTFVVLERTATRRAAWIGAMLVACYPVLFYTAGTFYPQTLSAVLLLGTLAILAGTGRINRRNYLMAGLFLGVAIMMVPNFIFTLAITAAWLILRERRRAPMAILCLLLPTMILLGGWAVRNYGVFHAFIPLSTNGGVTLLNGNSSTTDPNSSYFDASRHVSDIDALRHMNEVERDRYFRDRALEHIRENPARTLKLYGLKFLNWFHYTNRIMTVGEESRARNLVMLFTYWPLLFLVIVRLALSFRFPLSHFELLLLALYVGNGLFLSMFLPRIRYRLPFDYGLIMLAAIFLDAVVLRRLRRNSATGPRASGIPV
ncbi:MAG: glycosyltransferase family 39 protein [Candidatus Eisenbacteria bacterium]|nr:glycosyltransferase family 39 protein [Candidatus Eisenbacteria bacterium]